MTARQLRAQLREALFLSALCTGALVMACAGLILLLTGGSLGPSFHGDGERYHVLQYAVGSGIESALFWQAPPVDADETEAMGSLMDHLDVPDRLRPDLESCRWHTATDPSDSRNHLYLLFDSSTLELYILESFF